jgi:putative ABC transport system permease protein
MKLITHIEEGLQNLFSSKLRSILALLGILVGTASVVAMVSGGELATNEALKQFKTLGTDLLSLSISDNNSEGKVPGGSLSLQQASNTVFADKTIIDAAPYTQLYSKIQFEGHLINGSILGVTENFSKIVHVGLEKGRFISNLDGFGLFCVIGQSIYNDIKRYTFRDPVGTQIQIGKNYFTIIGIAKSWPENSFVYANIDSAILIPIMTSLAINKYTAINNIIFQLMPGANIDEIKTHISHYLTSCLGEKNIYFRSAKELIARMSSQSAIFTIFLGLIGGISLLVGGIGVMNIMLVSVIERRREIGIRMAVGAERDDIRSLFLVEAVMLALVGGVSGVIIGMLIAFVMSLFSHWEFLWLWLPPFIGFTVSAVTGVFFGYYPAYKASQLDPIDALKSD